MIEFTAFKNIFDNKVDKKYAFDDWDAFGSALHRMSKVKGFKPKRGEKSRKKPSPLISPAIFTPGSTRANDNVIRWSKWAALDVDEYDQSFEDTVQQFAPYNFICYSSASSTKEHPKFRIVMQLSDVVKADKIKHFWYALNTRFSNVGDPQTKDLSRMYYVPALYPNAYNFFFKNENKKVMDPVELMNNCEYTEPATDFLAKMPMEMQRAVVESRKSSLNNTNITWTSYRDCPFINKRQLQEYAANAGIDGSGRYAMFYKIMVTTAGSAVRRRYPITVYEISALMREIDNDNGARYKRRPIETEAGRALTYILRNAKTV